MQLCVYRSKMLAFLSETIVARYSRRVPWVCTSYATFTCPHFHFSISDIFVFMAPSFLNPFSEQDPFKFSNEYLLSLVKNDVKKSESIINCVRSPGPERAAGGVPLCRRGAAPPPPPLVGWPRNRGWRRASRCAALQKCMFRCENTSSLRQKG